MRLKFEVLNTKKEIYNYFKTLSEYINPIDSSTKSYGAIAIPIDHIDAEVDGLMMSTPESRTHDGLGIVPALLIDNRTIKIAYVNIQYATKISVFELQSLIQYENLNKQDVIDAYDKVSSLLLNIDVCITQKEDIKVVLQRKII